MTGANHAVDPAPRPTSDPRELTLPERPKPPRFLRWFYARFFSHIKIDDGWATAVRDSAKRGVVVYVMRTISFLDFLCLDWLTQQFGLPLLRFVNDVGLWILEPFGRGERRLRFRAQIPEDQALASVVGSGHSALMFLRKPPNVMAPKRKGRALEVDLIQTLVVEQRKMQRPILLVPQTFVWSVLPPNKRWSIWDVVFGPIDNPGKIRTLLQFLVNYRNVKLRTGAPFDLLEFLEANQELTDAEAAQKVRIAMLRRIERERTVVIGPHDKTPQRLRDEMLRSPRIRRLLEQTAQSTHKTVADVEREAIRELKKLQAAPDKIVISMFRAGLDRVWNRIYDGLVVDKEGIERLRSASREGNLILLPSHKSHIDYLVLSDVLYQYAMSPPLIAAGENLSFWPLGPVLRWGGAFFIKRSFRGKKLYAALVDAYIRKLMIEGFSIEFFLEGGRSRTGKLLPPKLGLLSMVVDASLEITTRPLYFVPISVGYERIVEQKSYVSELSGGKKKEENLGGLLRTSKVLRSRYGRLYVQFGELLKFDDVVREVTGDTSDTPRRELTPVERRSLVQKIAHRVVHEIDRSTVVTPAALTATVLLTNRRRGLRRQELLERAEMLLNALRARSAPLASTLQQANGGETQLRTEAIMEALNLFLDARLVLEHGEGPNTIYQIPDDRRLALEYYKNNIIHFFVASSLIASALQFGEIPAEESVLRERVRRLSRVYKYEFMYRADATFDEIFDDALNLMIGAGELERTELGIRPAKIALIDTYTAIMQTYFEAYRVALRAAATLKTPMSKKEWLKRAQNEGETMHLAGDIEHRESVARPKLENALAAMRDHGILVFDEGDAIKLGPEIHTEEDLRKLEERLRGFET